MASPEHRVVAGVSMGGAGAFRHALARPDVFGAGVALSPPLWHPLPPPDSSARAYGAFGRGEERFVDAIYQAAFGHLLDAAPRPDRPRLALGVGRDDELAPVVAAAHDRCLAAGVDSTLTRWPGGHDWARVGACLRAGSVPGSPSRRARDHRGGGQVSGPLEGLKVVDAATLFAGPLAATFLGDFGADVIKVEHPRRPDAARGHGPAKDGVGLWWKTLGRNKRTVTLDLSSSRTARPAASAARRRRRAGRELPAGHAGALGARARTCCTRPTRGW